jgi:hypothetical protein
MRGCDVTRSLYFLVASRTKSTVYSKSILKCIRNVFFISDYSPYRDIGRDIIRQNKIYCVACVTSSSYCWASLANALNVLQPYWPIVLPLDVPALTSSLLLRDPNSQEWNYI